MYSLAGMKEGSLTVNTDDGSMVGTRNLFEIEYSCNYVHSEAPFYNE